ncbi:MAG TPA: hypothetical protein VMT11_08020 [Myxococcaceae bacterium]|nr:hypothetical protein [Myxococcaceae bacterium]
MESDVVVKWIRSRASKRAERGGKQCTGCRTLVAGETEEQLHASGGVLLAGVGWFCGARCERQYRLRFRIQSAATPPDGSPRPTPTPAPRSATPPADIVEASEPSTPRRPPAADELAAVLRERRRRLMNGQ